MNRSYSKARSCAAACALLVLLLQAGGCALGPVLAPASERAFDFSRDAFAFDNQLEWRYRIDAERGTGEATGENPDAEYSRHCFVLSRSARQFFQFAEFDATAPRIDEAAYRLRIRAVVSHDPAARSPKPRVLFPGYASLRSFSRDWEDLLKEELGSAAQSYLQRGNWRMIFPFTQNHQSKTAAALAAEIAVNRPPVVHLVTFPHIKINHAVLLFGATEDAREIRFSAYDPNDSRQGTVLTYDRASGRFSFPTNEYFAGGRINVYEIYRSAVY